MNGVIGIGRLGKSLVSSIGMGHVPGTRVYEHLNVESSHNNDECVICDCLWWGCRLLLLLVLNKLNVILRYLLVLFNQKLLDLGADIALHHNLLSSAGKLGH